VILFRDFVAQLYRATKSPYAAGHVATATNRITKMAWLPVPLSEMLGLGLDLGLATLALALCGLTRPVPLSVSKL